MQEQTANEWFQAILAYGLLALALAIGIWDVICVSDGRPQDQVSAILRQWGKDHPILCVCVGILIGHVFW